MSEKIILKEPTYTKAEYNKEPVHYCTHCLSLRILKVNDFDYCDNCGSTDIDKCTIEEWENKYIKHYGHKFIKNGKQTED